MYYLYHGLGLFTKSKTENITKCKKCGSELHDPERLKRHQKIAHDKKNEKCPHFVGQHKGSLQLYSIKKLQLLNNHNASIYN